MFSVNCVLADDESKKHDVRLLPAVSCFEEVVENVSSYFGVDERASRSVLMGRVKMTVGGVTRFLSIASSLMVTDIGIGIVMSMTRTRRTSRRMGMKTIAIMNVVLMMVMVRVRLSMTTYRAVGG